MTTLIQNSWFLEYAPDICIYNQQKLFSIYVDLFKVLWEIILAKVFLSWGIILLLLA